MSGRLTSCAAAALVIALAAPASAATVWQVNAAASKLGFRGAMGGEAFAGVFRRWTAQIAFDPKALATSKAVVWIDMGSAATGDADRDQALPTADWFAAGAFPKASFITRGFKDLGGGRYQAIGDLTIRGVHRPLVLPFTLTIAGDTAKMTGAVQLNRLDFGVGQGRWKAADVVAPAVTVTVDLSAHRAR
jgi:polyisoprenoid-binding protein YceI